VGGVGGLELLVIVAAAFVLIANFFWPRLRWRRLGPAWVLTLTAVGALLAVLAVITLAS
jgi:hypothetical protein